MSQFRLTQISDTHLARHHTLLIDNFHRVSEHIDATRPDLVLNSGDVSFDGPTSRNDMVFAKQLHDALPVDCLYLPGNHDIGDNPCAAGPVPSQLPTEETCGAFTAVLGEDHWQFDAAGWCFIGLNSLIMNTGLDSEAEQFEWLAAALDKAVGKPVALFVHKPLYRDVPYDAERAETSFRYVPQPARRRLIEMFGKVDWRLVGSGHVHQRRDYTFEHVRHVWAPSAGFIIPDAKQEVIGIKEVGLVEYRFQPDSFEVRHVRAKGQVDVDLDMLHGKQPA
ncbi:MULTISPECIES: metallophosphoesterase [Bradyrhizobium]|jgi:3',5'-cyclic AMP phosphodiesterase CpdA|uniref:metallophosphoesterase family protein n=1 Tax=Bradyrhizobium TaxID=374 RepID=UPI000427068E|nr:MULTISPECIES: metallophosphoesterase [Bradyrhizobium]AUC97591.1 metallophosphoesterase [Bradyrhizobium sp. SK17]KIU43147.1 phosphohydrolase [Bradyrhizobium elkanii]MBK5652978.1 metallophosphoesterase [Rhizobium sp.]OCX30028.1 phosphohydrolase [Bradyrhizobium sp. UASWS1016]